MNLQQTDIRRKLELSRIEAVALKERDLRCPECEFKIQSVYSDAIGHLRVKCPKCKRIHILNLAYFRKMKNAAKIRRKLNNNDF